MMDKVMNHTQKMCFKRHGFSVYFRLRRLVNDLFEILDRDI